MTPLSDHTSFSFLLIKDDVYIVDKGGKDGGLENVGVIIVSKLSVSLSCILGKGDVNL